VVATAGSTSHNDVVYFRGVKPHTIFETIEYLGQDALRVHVVQGASFFALSSW
jgi:hypothetical protein